MKSLIWILVVCILVVVGGGIYFIIQQNNNTSQTPSLTSTSDSSPDITVPQSLTPQPKTVEVNIQNFAFSLATLNINQGDTVVWTNKDSIGHTVTSDSGNELNSELLSKGQTYSHTFNDKGTFSYHCIPHPNMKATVIVK